MKHIIEIENGSGWNNYEALRSLKTLPAGTKGLMKNNKVQTLNIGPKDEAKPFGIAARYYDAGGELLFTQSFDQNDSAEWIRSAVTKLLTKTIAVRLAERRAEIAAEELKAANKAGYQTAAEHQAAINAKAAEAKAAAAKERDARWAWLQGANGGKEAAESAMTEMKALRAACPQADGMTRGGKLGKLINPASPSGGWVEVFESHVLSSEARNNGMLAWLLQNGHRPGLDDRHFFFTAAA